MKLNYYRINKKLYDERVPPKSFIDSIKLIDKNLDIAWNRVSRRWEIYRKDSKNNWQWIICVENDDGSYRDLDYRVLRKLREMDVISRWGSVANYERHLDEKQKKWQQDREKEMNHELRCDLRDDRHLWQRAAEKAKSGIFNDPPEEKSRKLVLA